MLAEFYYVKNLKIVRLKNQPTLPKNKIEQPYSLHQIGIFKKTHTAFRTRKNYYAFLYYSTP